MPALADLRAGFTGALARSFATSGGEATVVPDAYVHMSSASGAFGMFDALRYGVDRATTPEQMDRAYRAVVGALVRFRGDVFGAHLAGLRAQRRDGGEWEDVEAGHNWSRLLARPNAGGPALDLYTALSQIVDLQGDAALVVERGRRSLGRTNVDGVPVALHLVWPEMGRVYPVLADTGSPAGYVLWLRDGTTHSLALEDVVRVRAVHPLAPHRSTSLAQLARTDIEADQAGDEYARDTLRDRGLPDVVLKVQETLRGEAGTAKALEIGRLFARTYRTGRRDRVPISHPGLEIEPLSMNARDMRVPEIRSATKERLHLVLGVHEGLFAKDTTMANAVAAERAFASHVVLPALRRYAAQIEHGFELAHGTPPDLLRLALPDGVVPEDTAARLRNDETRIATGTPVNVVLRERGEEPVGAQGDVSLVGAGLRPLAEVAGTAAPPETRRLGSQVRVAGHLSSADEAALREALERATDPVLVAALRFIESLVVQVSDALRAAEGADVDGAFFDDDAWDRAWQRVLQPALHAVASGGYSAGGVSGSIVTGSVPVWDDAFLGARPRLADALDLARSNAASVPRTLLDLVRSTLADGVGAGDGPDDLADRVAAAVRSQARTRSTLIARTTGKGVAERAAMEAYVDAGVELHRWASVFAPGTRASHAAQHGETVAIGEPFSNGLTHPGDPAGPLDEIANCLCYIVPVAGSADDG